MSPKTTNNVPLYCWKECVADFQIGTKKFYKVTVENPERLGSIEKTTPNGDTVLVSIQIHSKGLPYEVTVTENQLAVAMKQFRSNCSSGLDLVAGPLKQRPQIHALAS
jgi:hypothetical protein